MEISTNSIPKLLNDVVIEILTRLPVQSLLRFRAVCKSWLSLISSQQFIKTHLTNQKKDPNSTHHRIMLNCGGKLKHCSALSLLSEPIIDPFDTDLSSHSPGKSIRVVGSCDGLICLAIGKKDVILWNPSTRISKKLPDFGVILSCISYFGHGLGFDKSRDDYKVVCFFNRCWDFPEVLAKAYSLKTDQWRTIKSFKGRWTMDNPATYANGKLYWIANPSLELECGWHFFFLDLATEEYGVLKMPSYVKRCSYLSLGVSEGRLLVLCSHLSSADVWIMDDYGVGNKGTWTNMVTIPYVDDFVGYHYTRALYVQKNGEVVLLCGSKLVIFNAKDRSFRYPEIRNVSEFITANPYSESLVSPYIKGAI